MDEPVLTPRYTSEPTLESPEAIPQMLHLLSNKLLPIVVCSELALRRCDSEQLRPQLEKIQRSAGEARDLITRIRRLARGSAPDGGENPPLPASPM